MKHTFRFYIGGKFKFERTCIADDITQAWKQAHIIADEYPTNKFIEIAHIKTV